MYILLDFDVLKLAKVWAWNIYIYSVNILYWKYLQVPAAVPAKAAAFKAEIKKTDEVINSELWEKYFSILLTTQLDQLILDLPNPRNDLLVC